MAPIAPIFDVRLFIVLLLVTFLIDFFSWKYGKESNRKWKRNLPPSAKCIGRSYIDGRVQYYTNMIVSSAGVTCMASFFCSGFAIRGNEALIIVMFVLILAINISVRRILCINMSWICYDEQSVYWKKWNSKIVNRCSLKDIINYRIGPGSKGQFFYFSDGRKLHFFNLRKNLEDMCYRAGIIEWRKKTGFNSFTD